MKFELIERHRNLTDSELIEDVIEVSRKIRKDKVTREDYLKFGKYSASTLQDRFKSWFIVLEKAGLKPNRSPFDIPDKDLFENLASVWINLGRQPIHREMKAPLSKYGGNTYIHHFGTWMDSLRKFIEYENSDNVDEQEEMPLQIEESNKNDLDKSEDFSLDSRNISHRMRFSVLLRDGFRCTACGKSPITHPGTELHCDHIIPWSKGGKTIIKNLKSLCSECNLGKGNMSESF